MLQKNTEVKVEQKVPSIEHGKERELKNGKWTKRKIKANKSNEEE